MSSVPPVSPGSPQSSGGSERIPTRHSFTSPGAALRALAGPGRDERVHWAAEDLVGNALDGPFGRIRSAWEEIGPSGRDLVPGLVRTALEHPSCLTVEMAGMALGAQGEEGLTEVLALCRHPDFTVRMGAYLGLEAAGPAARGEVPRICRWVCQEQMEIAARLALGALIGIGGEEALGFVRRVAAEEAARGEDDGLAREALRHAGFEVAEFAPQADGGVR